MEIFRGEQTRDWGDFLLISKLLEAELGFNTAWKSHLPDCIASFCEIRVWGDLAKHQKSQERKEQRLILQV